MSYDRRIKIEYPIRVKGDDGDEAIVSWQLFIELWARAEPVRARERFAGEQMRGVKEVVFTFRWKSEITPDMRLTYNEEVYAILGIAEIGRRSEIEIVGQMVQASGES